MQAHRTAIGADELQLMHLQFDVAGCKDGVRCSASGSCTTRRCKHGCRQNDQQCSAHGHACTGAAQLQKKSTGGRKGRTVDDDWVHPRGKDDSVSQVALELASLGDGSRHDSCGGRCELQQQGRVVTWLALANPHFEARHQHLGEDCRECASAAKLLCRAEASRKLGRRKGKLRSHRELEEPAVPSGLGNPVQSKAVPADEVVAVVATVRQAVTDEVEADGTKASVQQVFQDNVLCVLGSD